MNRKRANTLKMLRALDKIRDRINKMSDQEFLELANRAELVDHKQYARFERALMEPRPTIAELASRLPRFNPKRIVDEIVKDLSKK